jgi:transposase
MLPKEKKMEIFELFDLTKSASATAELAGVDPRTVRRVIAARAAGIDSITTSDRDKVTDPYADKIEEWVDRSNAKIRGDVVHRRLLAMGYKGSERTTRRIVAQLKKQWRQERHRLYKPWITEPGLWLQYDFGEGPRINGDRTVLFCAWAAWSRFRVIIPIQDKTLPSVIAALDETFRILGGCPTYVLTDNEKTVTDGHIAGIALRNQVMLSASLYYGVTIATCVPYDPESKGGSESSVKLAKADIVPTEANLAAAYSSFIELEEVCAETMTRLNERVHAVTKKRPVDMIVIEREHFHRVPREPYTIAFGESRSVSWSSTVTFRGSRYSIPAGSGVERVWVRVQGKEVVIVQADPNQGQVRELARHNLLGPGQASIDDAHYPPRPDSPGSRVPRATRPSEAAFLAIGHGANRWLIEACASGTRQAEEKMAEAVQLTKTHGTAPVDEALGLAALSGRFSTEDLVSILRTRRGETHRARDFDSLQPGTSSWEGFGQ